MTTHTTTDAAPAHPARTDRTERPERSAPARADRPARPASRPHGQWKVDGTEPLNANEEWKQVDNGLSVRDRIERVYSKGGFASIDPTDLHGRFRVWGLYTQRKPGIDGGRTATLEPHELEDEYFMLRVRIDGGQLTTEQLRVIAGISTEFGRDTADLTDRQNIQLHWIRVEDVPEIWRRLEGVGLGTTEACGDVPRVVLGSPVAGIAADELIDPTPQIDEITSRFIGDESLANLPRKFKTAITGHPSQDVVHEINDVAFVAVRAPRARRRLRPLGRRRALDGTAAGRTARRLRRARARRRGLARRRPDLPRLRLPAPAQQGAAEVPARRLGHREVPRGARDRVPRGTAARRPRGSQAARARRPRRRAPPEGRPVLRRRHADRRPGLGPALAKLADLIEAHGSSRLRTTPHQKLVILDIPEDRVESLITGLDELGLSARPSLIRRGTIACTGIEFCKLAIVETKAFATAAVLDLERTLDGFDLPHPISLHVNGCPNSCARIQTADIGLKGQLIMDDDGEQVPGYQVHLGGGLATADREEAGLGRTVRGLKVTADGIADYVERVVKRFLDDRDAVTDETFAEWAHRVDEEALR